MLVVSVRKVLFRVQKGPVASRAEAVSVQKGGFLPPLGAVRGRSALAVSRRLRDRTKLSVYRL